MQKTPWVAAPGQASHTLRWLLATLLAMALALALASCASMEPDQCRAADWLRVGQSDGARGDNPNSIAAYTEDCAQVGIRPDAGRYRQGWDIGIKDFCTPRNGWRAGTTGQSGKADACAGQAGDAAFSHYFDAGHRLYDTKQRMRGNSAETSRLERQLDRANSDHERRNLRDRLRHVDREQSDLRYQLDRQESLGP